MFKTTLHLKSFLIKNSFNKAAVIFNFNESRNFLRYFSNDSKIISVENRRKLVEKGKREEEEAAAAKAPSYLPPADFAYNYKPMTVLEESIGIK